MATASTSSRAVTAAVERAPTAPPASPPSRVVALGAARPLRVAAVGLGWVTTHRHLPVMRSMRRAFEVVGVVDRRPGRAAAIAGGLNIRRSAECDSLDAVPWLDEVDAVTVGTAPMGHHALIRQALDRGLHVLTEKPFTMTVEEGRSLVEMAAARGKTLAIVHNFQFARSMQALLADIGSGRLGAIRSVSATQFGNPRRRLPEWYETLPLGLFYDESPHLLYLARNVAGPSLALRRAIVTPDPSGARTPAALDVFCSADLPGGGSLPVTIRCDFRSAISEWFLRVQGEDFIGIVDIFRDIYLRLPNDGAHTTLSVLRTSLAATWQHWWQHVPSGLRHLAGRLHYGNEQVFARFADAALGGPTPRDIGAGDALAVLQLQHDIIAAAETV